MEHIPGAKVLLHEIMWYSAHSWRRLQVRQNTYFCTLDNGDCIAYNQASMKMDLLLHTNIHCLLVISIHLPNLRYCTTHIRFHWEMHSYAIIHFSWYSEQIGSTQRHTNVPAQMADEPARAVYWYAIFWTICFYLLPAIICRYRYCHSNFGMVMYGAH